MTSRLELSVPDNSEQQARYPEAVEAPDETPGETPAGQHRPDPAHRARDLAFLSYLRVLAIVGVILVHTAGLTAVNPELHGSGVWHLSVLLDLGCKWCVPVFVMISGALLLQPSPAEGAWDFYRRRLRRIGIPLVFWHGVYLAFVAVVLGTELTVLRAVQMVLTVRVYTALYFFWLILGLYLVAPVLRAFVAHASRRDLWVVSLLALGGGLAYQALGNVIATQGWGRGNAPLNALTYFMPYIGYFLAGYALRDVVLPRAWRIVAAVAVLAICVETAWHWEHKAELPWLDVLSPPSYLGAGVATCSLLLFVLARSLIPPASRLAEPPYATAARRLGDLTLGVFVVHLLVLYGLQRIDTLAGGADTVAELLALPVATTVGAFAVSWLLSKIPVLRQTV